VLAEIGRALARGGEKCSPELVQPAAWRLRYATQRRLATENSGSLLPEW